MHGDGDQNEWHIHEVSGRSKVGLQSWDLERVGRSMSVNEIPTQFSIWWQNHCVDFSWLRKMTWRWAGRKGTTIVREFYQNTTLPDLLILKAISNDTGISLDTLVEDFQRTQLMKGKKVKHLRQVGGFKNIYVAAPYAHKKFAKQ